MARQSATDRVRDALQTLNALAPVVARADQLRTLTTALADRNCRVVARAATLAGERLLHELIPALLDAHGRFLEDPVKRDPGCTAKQAIARALVQLECRDLAFWRAGIRYRQLEPAWGGRTDTATDLRCSCAMGLAGSGELRAVAELTGLLADPQTPVRVGAARAISCGNPHEAEAVLRLKVQLGDAEPEVLGECFAALLVIAPEPSVPFVAGYLSGSDEAVAEYAALALGESRRPEALGALREAWADTVSVAACNALIRAAALHRSEEAFAWLLELIATGSATQAQAAADALSVYERNTRLLEQVTAAKTRRTVLD